MYALLAGRGYVLPEDLKALVEPVFGHRILLSPDAQLRGVTAADVLADAVTSVPVPLPAGANGSAPGPAPGVHAAPGSHAAHGNHAASGPVPVPG